MSRRLPWAAAALPGLALTLAACMSGRPSLVATNPPRTTAALQGAGDSADGSLIGPARSSTGSLVSSGGGAARLGGPVQAQANVGALKLTGGLSATVGSAASLASTGTRGSAAVGVAITPALAPAASVGASVAAVSQPLAVVASAKAKTGLKPAARGVSAQVQTGIGGASVGASLHVGGG